MSTRPIRPAWIVLAAGGILLSAIIAVRNKPDSPNSSKPGGKPSQSGPAAQARPEAQRVVEQARILESLRAPIKDTAVEAPPQEMELRREAAQHPAQFPALLRTILSDPRLDDRWKRTALLTVDVAASVQTLDVVLGFLKTSESAPLKAAAAEALGTLGHELRHNRRIPIPPECLAVLEKLRADPSPQIRTASHAALWRATFYELSGEQRATFVRQVLEDPDVTVFAMFALALRGAGGLDGGPVLDEVTRQFSRLGDPLKRAAIVRALGGAAPGKAHPLLSGALTDGDPDVRRAAIVALSRLKEASVVPTLRVMLEDESLADPETKRALLKGLAGMGTRDAVQAVGRYAVGNGAPELRDEALGLLQSAPAVKGDDELAALLIRQLENTPDPERRASLATTIGCTETARAAEALRAEYGKNKDPGYREALANAALGIKHEAAFTMLAEALTQVTVPGLKREIMTFLGEQRRPELLPALRAEYAAPESDADYRIEVIDAAVKVGTPAASAFVRDALGREKDEQVRRRLEEALEQLRKE